MTSPAASHPTSPRGEGVLSIVEVLGLLRPEFPDVTISKLRFLEAEGLVEPMRAPSGYRKYTRAHVERLRFVLAAQRDRYLPLRVIREQVEALDRGERVVGLPPLPSPPSVPAPARVPVVAAVPAAPTPVSAPVPSVAPVAPAPRTDFADNARLTREQLAERSGLDEAGLVDLEQYGLLVPGPNGFYGGEALTVARIAAQLAEYGLEGRHLRPYRATADREVGLLAQLVTTMAKQGSPGAREHAFETVHELAALCAQLHGALVRQGLRQVLGG
jgi:DNA-binding transcriptional MerR regulator